MMPSPHPAGSSHEADAAPLAPGTSKYRLLNTPPKPRTKPVLKSPGTLLQSRYAPPADSYSAPLPPHLKRPTKQGQKALPQRPEMVTEDVPPLPSHPPRRPSLENVEVTDNLFPDDVPGADDFLERETTDSFTSSDAGSDIPVTDMFNSSNASDDPFLQPSAADGAFESVYNDEISMETNGEPVQFKEPDMPQEQAYDDFSTGFESSSFVPLVQETAEPVVNIFKPAPSAPLYEEQVPPMETAVPDSGAPVVFFEQPERPFIPSAGPDQAAIDTAFASREPEVLISSTSAMPESSTYSVCSCSTNGSSMADAVISRDPNCVLHGKKSGFDVVPESTRQRLISKAQALREQWEQERVRLEDKIRTLERRNSLAEVDIPPEQVPLPGNEEPVTTDLMQTRDAMSAHKIHRSLFSKEHTIHGLEAVLANVQGSLRQKSVQRTGPPIPEERQRQAIADLQYYKGEALRMASEMKLLRARNSELQQGADKLVNKLASKSHRDVDSKEGDKVLAENLRESLVKLSQQKAQMETQLLEERNLLTENLKTQIDTLATENIKFKRQLGLLDEPESSDVLDGDEKDETAPREGDEGSLIEWINWFTG